MAGAPLFLTGVLADLDVALEPVADERWLVRVAALPLAIFDERTWRLDSPQGPRQERADKEEG